MGHGNHARYPLPDLRQALIALPLVIGPLLMIVGSVYGWQEFQAYPIRNEVEAIFSIVNGWSVAAAFGLIIWVVGLILHYQGRFPDPPHFGRPPTGRHAWIIEAYPTSRSLDSMDYMELT